MDNVNITPEELKALIDQTYRVEEEFVALRHSYAQLQGTIEQVIAFLPNAIWIVEGDGSVFLQNSKAEELGLLLGELRLDEDDYECSFDNRYYLIKTSKYKEKNIISATDITEQRRKENLATMGQMAAHLSHEIRNPIGSIALLASTLMKRSITENKPIVLEIQKAIYRIERIIKATLMFSKGVKASIEPILFKELLEAMETAVGYYSYSKPIRFHFPEQNFILNGDLELLSMLFSNFLFNAIDAIEEDDNEEGEIEIGYRNDGSYHCFSIYDSGVDIPDREGLFEAFKSSKEKGNGLGLLLCKQIAEAHGGYVRLLEGEKKVFEVAIGL